MSNTVMLFVGIGIGMYIMSQKHKTAEALKAMQAAAGVTV